MIDKWSFDALELQTILNEVETFSELGKKKRRNTQPFLPGDEEELRQYFHKLDALISIVRDDNLLQDRLKSEISHFKDISSSINRLGSKLDISEIFEIKQFCYFYQRVLLILTKNNYPYLNDFESLMNIYQLLDPEKLNTATFKISNLYSKELADVRELIAVNSRKRKILFKKHKQDIQEKLSLQRVEEKIVVSRYDKATKELLESSNLFLIQEANFANTIYKIKIPLSVTEIDEIINGLLIKQEILSSEVIQQLSDQLSPYKQDLLKALNNIASLDDTLGKAMFSLKYECISPTISTSYTVEIIQSVNIPIYESLKRIAIDYQKTDIILNDNVNILVGANMAGKSSSLITLGQFSYLIQHGFPVPALKSTLPLFDFILFSGDEAKHKSIDLSSFGKEIVRVNSYLNKSGKGLYLIDEFARGTNPEEGNALSRALFETLKNRQGLSFCATHFSEPLKIRDVGLLIIPGITLKDFEEIRCDVELNPEARLKNLHKKMKYDIIKIDKEQKTPRAGIMIAELLGTNSDIISKAKSYLK